MASKKDIPPDLAEELRRAFVRRTAPIATLAARAGLSPRVFAQRAKEHGWKRRPASAARRKPKAASSKVAPAKAASANSASTTAKSRAPTGRQRGARPTPKAASSAPPDAVADLSGLLDRQIAAVEAFVHRLAAGDPDAAGEVGPQAQAVAAMTRTLKELFSLRAQMPASGPMDDDDDDMPRDIEQFRAALAQRIDALFGAGADEAGAARPAMAGTENPQS